MATFPLLRCRKGGGAFLFEDGAKLTKLSDASRGKGQEQTQMIAMAIGRPIPTAPLSNMTKSRSRPVPT
jgi:hypothetical protein